MIPMSALPIYFCRQSKIQNRQSKIQNLKLAITSALQINQILRQGTLILISVLLAKTYVSVSEIGVYETLLFLGTTVSYFWLTALTQTTLSFLPSQADSDKPATISTLYVLVCLWTLGLFCLLCLAKKPVLYVLVGQTDLAFYGLFAVFLLFNLPAFLLDSFLTVENRPLSILAFSSLSNIGLILATIAPLVFGQPFAYSFYGMILIGVIRFVWLTVFVIQKRVWIFDKPKAKTFSLLCLPLMGYAFLNGFSLTYVNWLVNWFYQADTVAFALFRYGAREFPLTTALTMGLSNAFIPTLTRSFQNAKPPNTVHRTPLEGDGEGKYFQNLGNLKRQSERLWHILFPLSILLMLSSHWLFPVVFNPQFAKSAVFFNDFLLLMTSRALFPQTILLALKENRTMLWISIIETITLLILAYALIFIFQIHGVVWAIVLAYWLEKILITLFLKRRYKIDFQSYTNVPLYFIYTGLLLLAYCFSLIRA
jgi:O-antigen/teichoic acid export membrane protein